MANSPQGSFSRADIILLTVLAISQFTHIVDFMIIMPLGPQLMRLFAISPSEFSLLVSAYTFCAGISGFFGAFFLDRFDRKRSFLLFYVGFTLGTLGCALAPNYEVLLLMRCLAGTFGGVLGSMIFSIIGDAIASEKRGAANGIIMGAFSMASIFGVPFSLYLASLGSWHTPLFALAGLSFATIFLVMWTIPPQRSHLGADFKATFQFIRSVPWQRRPGLAMLIMAIVVFGQFAVVPFLSPSLVANTGLREDQLPYIYLVGGLLSIISAPLIGRWVDRKGPISVFFITAPLSIIPLVGITLLGPTPLYGVLIMAGLFFLVMGGRMIPTLTFVTGSVVPRFRGAFMSLSNSMQQMAAGAASLVAGHVITKDAEGHLLNYPWIGGLSALLTLVALIIAYLLRKEPAQVH